MEGGNELLRVWTVQRRGWWESLERRRVLYGDGRRVSRGFRPAYRWLMRQMRARIPGYRGGFPVWVWHSPKPDLRRAGHLRPDERGVRVELELPRTSVLLLDFETWHCVLNRWHVSLSWRDSRAWDRRVEALPQWWSLPPRMEAELEASWERVFDLETLRRAKLWGPVDRIQGVTEFVRLDDVRSVDGFVSR
jgi:hypothetical protein